MKDAELNDKLTEEETSADEIFKRVMTKKEEKIAKSLAIDWTLSELLKIWAQYPDLRLGQLIINAVPEQMLYHITDTQLINKLKKFYISKEKDQPNE